MDESQMVVRGSQRRSWVDYRGGPGWITEEVLTESQRESWVAHRGIPG